MKTLSRILLLALLSSAFTGCKKEDIAPADKYTCTTTYREANNPTKEVEYCVERFDTTGYLSQTDYPNNVTLTYKYDLSHHLVEYSNNHAGKVLIYYTNGLKSRIEFYDAYLALIDYFTFENNTAELSGCTHFTPLGPDSEMSFYFSNGLMDSCKVVDDMTIVAEGGDITPAKKITLYAYGYDNSKNLTSYSERSNSDPYQFENLDVVSSITYEYNGSNQLINEYIDEALSNKYTYDSLGNIAMKEHYENNSLSRTYHYSYTDCGTHPLTRLKQVPWILM